MNKLLILLSIVICQASHTPHPDDVTLCMTTIGHEEICYSYYETKVNWATAKKNCESTNGTSLARPETNSLNGNVKRIIQGVIKWVWIAGNDLTTEGSWEWTTGDPIVWTKWMQNAGHRPIPETMLGNTFDCLALDSRDGDWADKDCDDKFAYVCQQPPSKPTTPATTPGATTPITTTPITTKPTKTTPTATTPSDFTDTVIIVTVVAVISTLLLGGCLACAAFLIKRKCDEYRARVTAQTTTQTTTSSDATSSDATSSGGKSSGSGKASSEGSSSSHGKSSSSSGSKSTSVDSDDS